MGNTVLVCGGRWHDFDYAREQLRKLLGRRVPVSDDYAIDLTGVSGLVTYTCDVRPTRAQQRMLADFVAGGGRWLALHGTNSAIDPPSPGGPPVFHTPDVLGPVVDVLGSRFVGHPPIAPYRVEITAPTHPLVKGIGPFEVRDEQYVCALRGGLEVLAHTEVTEPCRGFADGGGGRQPVLYLRRYGDGQVCYFTLGHCRGRFDVADLGVPDTGVEDRGSWEVPQFRKILGRAVKWVRAG
jgi:hypothetical protein